jgi:hypothetical protein
VLTARLVQVLGGMTLRLGVSLAIKPDGKDKSAQYAIYPVKSTKRKPSLLACNVQVKSTHHV